MKVKTPDGRAEIEINWQNVGWALIMIGSIIMVSGPLISKKSIQKKEM